LTENITSFQHSFVVTEQGTAACFGRTQAEQALNLITNAAHPSAQESLIAAASKLKLIS
jgi:acyl-CoA hydrolase